MSPSFPAVRENISASQNRPKPQMRFVKLLYIPLRLDFSLSIFIIPSDLFYQGEYGYIVVP